MIKTKLGLAILFAMFSLMALMAQDKDAAKKPAEAPAQTSAPAPAPAAAPADTGEYRIGSDDVLHINVWKEPELSGQVSVRPDGKVSLALLNDIQAAGKTPIELANEITEKIKQYVSDPRVTVTVVQMNSRRIFIMGEAARAGAFPMLPHMTLMQALSSAGGMSPYANVKKMYLLRNESGKQTKIPINYKALISGNAPEQNIELKPGDTIVIP